MGKKKPPELPPIVKGWWEYRECEPDTCYVSIFHYCKKHRQGLQGDPPNKIIMWVKIHASETPFEAGPMMLQNLSTSQCTTGYLTRREDGSWKLLRFLSGKPVFHIPQSKMSQWRAFKILGEVRLPSKEKGGTFLAIRYRDFLKCNDKECRGLVPTVKKNKGSTRENSEQNGQVLVFPKEG